jgi:hypothetical protein
VLGSVVVIINYHHLEMSQRNWQGFHMWIQWNNIIRKNCPNSHPGTSLVHKMLTSLKGCLKQLDKTFVQDNETSIISLFVKWWFFLLNDNFHSHLITHTWYSNIWWACLFLKYQNYPHDIWIRGFDDENAWVSGIRGVV